MWLQRPTTLRDWLMLPIRLVSGLLKRLLIGLVRFYQLFISPLKPPSCRFYPTCSSYAIEALKVHGPIKGLWLTVKRVGKCHPLHPGGVDLVPPKNTQQASSTSCGSSDCKH